MSSDVVAWGVVGFFLLILFGGLNWFAVILAGAGKKAVSGTKTVYGDAKATGPSWGLVLLGVILLVLATVASSAEIGVLGLILVLIGAWKGG